MIKILNIEQHHIYAAILLTVSKEDYDNYKDNVIIFSYHDKNKQEKMIDPALINKLTSIFITKG